MKNETVQRVLGHVKTAAKSVWDAFLSASTKRKIAIIAVVFVMVGFTVNNFDRPEVALPVLKYSDFSASLEGTPIDQSKCEGLRKDLSDSASLKLAAKNFAAAKRASQKLTAWNASEFAGKTAWMKLTPTLLEDHTSLVGQTSDSILTQRVSALNKPEATALFDSQPDVWSTAFARFTVTSCELEDVFNDSSEKIRDYLGFKARIQTLAASRPWYPEGFEETSFAGFAYKNISNQGCSYSFGSCAKFKIVSQTDCPSNLYVKTNLLDNDTVIDWSNDTASVRAGQVALMETTFTADGGDHWQIVEINCY